MFNPYKPNLYEMYSTFFFFQDSNSVNLTPEKDIANGSIQTTEDIIVNFNAGF